MKHKELNQAVWMLADAIKYIITSEERAAKMDLPSAEGNLTKAIDSIAAAIEAIEKTNILPY